MTKEDFIRKMLLSQATHDHISSVTKSLSAIKSLADELFPVDKEQMHLSIIRILRNANIPMIANPQTSMEDKYKHLKEVLTDSELSDEDIKLYSHLWQSEYTSPNK